MSDEASVLQVAVARAAANNLVRVFAASPLRGDPFLNMTRESLRAFDTDTLKTIWDIWDPDTGWGVRDPGMYIIEGIHWVLSERGEQHLVPI